jgi:transposase
MDMWRPYVRATREHVDGWETRVCFDRFHVAKYLGDAVNDVRKAEHKELLQNGDDRLKRTRFLWLMGPDKLDRLNDRQRVQFDELKASTLRVARAWAIKETARELWGYVRRDWALRAWERWLVWAFRSKLEPIRKAARVIQNNLWGIINAVVKNVTNATSESLNAKIQWVKKNACGFRNRDRFRTAILFHCGGLDLYPDTLFHTKS